MVGWVVRGKTNNGKGKSKSKSEMRGSLHCGGKIAASGRDDGVFERGRKEQL